MIKIIKGSTSYRNDLDGLKGICVLAVIFFHSNLDFLNGGFAGVDIFFVLSGFFITLSIIRKISEGKFDLIKFYLRRIKRIFPQVLFVSTASIPFSLFLLDPSQLRLFSESFTWSLLFSTNIFFWRSGGSYFAESINDQPLLHLWSLGIEMQFYILFPIFIILSNKFINFKKISQLVLALTVISLLLSQWASINSPAANFYLLPPRAWELLLGSLCGIYVFKNGLKSNNFLALVGIFSIISSFFFINASANPPSLIMLFPVIGALLIIIYSNKTDVGKILGTFPLKQLGLMSYSLYLWHHPVFSFIDVLAPFPKSKIIFLFEIFKCDIN